MTDPQVAEARKPVIPLTYTERAERYIRQRTGQEPDERRMLADQVTPRQRRRMFKKERRSWPGYSRRAVDMPWDPRHVDLDDYEPDAHYCVTPGCNCCGDDDD